MLNIFFKITEKNITRENFKYALVVFHEIFEVFSNIKIFNYDILNQLYVFILIILNFLVQLQALVEDSVCKVHDYLPKEFSTKSVNELNAKSDKNNSDRLSLENVCLMNTLNVRLSRFTNLFLQLELFYRDSKFIFPAIEEKYYREKIFGTNTPMFGAFHTMESNENGETNNISSEEYILNYNPRRSNGLIEFNLSYLNKLLSRSNNFVIKEVVMLEKLISSCRKMDLKSLLEIDIKDIMPAFKTNEENEPSKLDSLAFIDDEEGVKDFFSKISFVDFEQFFTEEYFDFNRIRLLSAISNNFVTNSWDQITTFTDYQNIKLQKVLYQTYLSESDIRATPRSTFNKLLLEKDVEKWKAFVQHNQSFKNITELCSISNPKDTLPKNSVFLILEPDDNFYNYYGQVFHLGEAGLTKSLSHTFELGGLIINNIKLVLKKAFDAALAETSTEVVRPQINKDLYKEKILLEFEKENSQEKSSFSQITTFLEDFLQQFENEREKLKQELLENPKATDAKKKLAALEEPQKFNSLVILTHHKFISFPFELLFAKDISKFETIVKDVCFQTFVKRLQTDEKSKIVKIFETGEFKGLATYLPQ